MSECEKKTFGKKVHEASFLFFRLFFLIIHQSQLRAASWNSQYIILTHFLIDTSRSGYINPHKKATLHLSLTGSLKWTFPLTCHQRVMRKVLFESPRAHYRLSTQTLDMSYPKVVPPQESRAEEDERSYIGNLHLMLRLFDMLYFLLHLL